jgi:alcohol dehydrogenase class IV
MNFNSGCSTELTDTAVRYAEIAAILDVETSALRQSTVDAVRAVRILKTSVLRQSALGAVRAVRILIEKLHIPTSVKDAGISRRDFEAALDPLVDAVMADPTLASNPIKCSRDEVVDLFRKAYNGEH